MNILKKFIHFIQDSSRYFYNGFRAGLLLRYIVSFLRSFLHHFNQFHITLFSKEIQQHHINEEQILKLKHTSQGLHSLMPSDTRFSYSILLPIDTFNPPKMAYFRDCLLSLIQQSPSQLEILIGFTPFTSKQMVDGLAEIKENFNKNLVEKIKIFELPNLKNEEEVINFLAKESSHRFLLIMGPEDWIRPDLLLRFEQALRIFSEPEKMVLYCNLNSINQKGYFIPESEYKQPSEIHFPYIFKPILEKGFLFPKKLWEKAGGFNRDYKSAKFEKLLLDLRHEGAVFQHLPFPLYSVRGKVEIKRRSCGDFIEAMQSYAEKNHPNWTWSVGYHNQTFRAIPPLPNEYSIQVIIPFKDQKELTLKCFYSVLKQINVKCKITVIDNGSSDHSIRDEMQKLGGEVLKIDEPFNYSRLNNLAVKNTKIASQCQIILFLNNDVELHEGALEEMLRWIDQPKIGMVGCRLHYPDGRLQHGGVALNHNEKGELRSKNIEKLKRFDQLKCAKTLGFIDVVTCACAMIKRQVFLEAGGFDEIWYPIGYSDINLAMKIAANGLKCFYTPYAAGIHHESVSRKASIEDFEQSSWLHQILLKEFKD